MESALVKKKEHVAILVLPILMLHRKRKPVVTYYIHVLADNMPSKVCLTIYLCVSWPQYKAYWNNRYLCTDRFGFLLYLLQWHFNGWFVKCNAPCLTSIFYSLHRYLSHPSPLSLSPCGFPHRPNPAPVTQGVRLLLLDNETLVFSLHGQCSTCNNVGDNDAVSTLILM